MSRLELATVLADVLDERRKVERDVVPRQVIGRNTDGSEQQLRLDGTCPERGDGAHRIGEIVTLPAARPDHRGGSGGGSVSIGGIGVLWVDHQEPREMARGATNAVRIIGRGMSAGMNWEYLRRVEVTEDNVPGTEPDPGIRVETATYVDPEHYDLEVSVAPDAAPRTGAPIAFSRSRASRRDDFYDVVASDAWNLHGFFGTEGSIRMARYLDGAYVDDVGSTADVYPLSDFYPIYGSPLVSDGSIAWIQGDERTPQVRVWDWAAEHLYISSLPADWVGHGVAYMDGYLWWVAYLLDGSTTLETRLYRATPDLESVDVHGSQAVDLGFPTNWLFGYGGYYPALYAPGYCGVICSYLDYGGEVYQPILLRYSVPGGVCDIPELDGEPPCHGLTIPVDGRGVYVSAEPDEVAVGQWDGAATLAPWWPAAWDEPVGSGPFSWRRDFAGVGRSLDGSRVYLYNQDLRRLVIAAAEPGPEPEAVIDVEPHPVSGDEKARFWPAPV